MRDVHLQHLDWLKCTGDRDGFRVLFNLVAPIVDDAVAESPVPYACAPQALIVEPAGAARERAQTPPADRAPITNGDQQPSEPSPAQPHSVRPAEGSRAVSQQLSKFASMPSLSAAVAAAPDRRTAAKVGAVLDDLVRRVDLVTGRVPPSHRLPPRAPAHPLLTKRSSAPDQPARLPRRGDSADAPPPAKQAKHAIASAPRAVRDCVNHLVRAAVNAEAAMQDKILYVDEAMSNLEGAILMRYEQEASDLAGFIEDAFFTVESLCLQPANKVEVRSRWSSWLERRLVLLRARVDSTLSTLAETQAAWQAVARRRPGEVPGPLELPELARRMAAWRVGWDGRMSEYALAHDRYLRCMREHLESWTSAQHSQRAATTGARAQVKECLDFVVSAVEHLVTADAIQIGAPAATALAPRVLPPNMDAQQQQPLIPTQATAQTPSAAELLRELAHTNQQLVLQLQLQEARLQSHLCSAAVAAGPSLSALAQMMLHAQQLQVGHQLGMQMQAAACAQPVHPVHPGLFGSAFRLPHAPADHSTPPISAQPRALLGAQAQAAQPMLRAAHHHLIAGSAPAPLSAAASGSVDAHAAVDAHGWASDSAGQASPPPLLAPLPLLPGGRVYSRRW